jgi:hypothetical protein
MNLFRALKPYVKAKTTDVLLISRYASMLLEEQNL